MRITNKIRMCNWVTILCSIKNKCIGEIKRKEKKKKENAISTHTHKEIYGKR